MGQRMLALLERQLDDSTTSDHWNLLRALAADLQEQRFLRAAASLPENLMAVLLHVHGALQIEIPEQLQGPQLVHFVTHIPQTEWSDDLSSLYNELHALRLLAMQDEPVVSLGGLSAALPAEDVGQREQLPSAAANSRFASGAFVVGIFRSVRFRGTGCPIARCVVNLSWY